MSDDKAIQLLQEIRDLQKQQLELSKQSFERYNLAVDNHDKDASRGKKFQIGFVIILILFMLFVVYAEWFMDGIPRPSWMTP